jgi:hypothetical protein
MILYVHVHEWDELWKTNWRNLKLIQNKKIVSCDAVQLQMAVISLFKIEILSSTHR